MSYLLRHRFENIVKVSFVASTELPIGIFIQSRENQRFSPCLQLIFSFYTTDMVVLLRLVRILTVKQ